MIYLLPSIFQILEKDFCADSMDYFFDGFVLDTYAFGRLLKLSPQCRNGPCDLVRYLIQNTVQNVESVTKVESFHELAVAVYEILKPIYTSYVCPCHVELMDWLVESGRFYDANVLYNTLSADDILNIKRVLRNIDHGSLKRLLQRTMTHFCAEIKRGPCLDDMMESLTFVAKNVDNTMDRYEEFDGLSETDRQKKKLRSQCDNYFDLVEASDDMEDLFEYDVKRDLEVYSQLFSMVYCKKNCKAEISKMYPCCLKKALDDKKLYKYGKNFAVSFISFYSIITTVTSNLNILKI